MIHCLTLFVIQENTVFLTIYLLEYVDKKSCKELQGMYFLLKQEVLRNKIAITLTVIELINSLTCT